MCLFNEHMADKHWNVLQLINVEKEAKVEYKTGASFLIIFILFILGNLECLLNMLLLAVSLTFIFLLFAYW